MSSFPNFVRFGAKCPWGTLLGHLSFGAKCLLAGHPNLHFSESNTLKVWEDEGVEWEQRVTLGHVSRESVLRYGVDMI